MKAINNASFSRRSFLAGSLAAGLLHSAKGHSAGKALKLADLERHRVLAEADKFLSLKPRTITAIRCQRSAGGIHDYYSEGDYWWPDPQNPGGAYIRRDGYSNPENFIDHREALLNLSVQMPALTAAWLVSRKKQYAETAAEHLRAWFLNPATRMNPNLQYAQAIYGVNTGRGIGIIDTLHLVEVSRAACLIERAKVLSPGEIAGLKNWFAQYVSWMTTSKNGLAEKEEKNNHGTCWVVQVAQFASHCGDRENIAMCRERFRSVLLPNQVAVDGSLPLELARTKPYSYSLFDLDMLGATCQLLSSPGENLWQFKLADGRGMRRAVDFLYPFIADKTQWPFQKDVEYFDNLPVRISCLLFAGLAYAEPKYIELWKQLNPEPEAREIVRNNPLRQPLLWVPSET